MEKYNNFGNGNHRYDERQFTQNLHGGNQNVQAPIGSNERVSSNHSYQVYQHSSNNIPEQSQFDPFVNNSVAFNAPPPGPYSNPNHGSQPQQFMRGPPFHDNIQHQRQENYMERPFPSNQFPLAFPPPSFLQPPPFPPLFPANINKSIGPAQTNSGFQPQLCSQVPRSDEVNYQSSENRKLPVDENLTKHNTQGTGARNEDDWIQGWIRDMEFQIKNVKDTNKDRYCDSRIKIGDVQRKLLEYAKLLQDLEEISQNLSQSSELEEDDLNELFFKAETLKENIRALKKYFSDPEIIKKIGETLERRRLKRLRRRKSHKVQAAKLRKLKEIWQKKGQIIDEKLLHFQEEETAKRSEVRLRQEADAILREVRTKQEEVGKMQKMLQLMSRLREMRIKKGEIHGYVPSPAANEFFVKLKVELKKLTEEQMVQYQAEEQTLKVMMEESKGAAHRPVKTKRNRKWDVEALKNEIYEVLFGSKSEQSGIERSFLAAEESSEILVKRRNDWDQFLVPEDTTNSSSIPISWISPNTASNSDWKAYQELKITK